MKLTHLLEDGTDKTVILKLQQEILELLPDEVDVSIESHPNLKSTWRLRCKVEGHSGSAVIGIGSKVTQGLSNYIVAMLLKDKLKQLGFDNKTSGRYYLGRPDGREYSCKLHIMETDNGEPPFKIIARHRTKSGSEVYAIATVYSVSALDAALKYLDEQDVSWLDSRDPNVNHPVRTRRFE